MSDLTAEEVAAIRERAEAALERNAPPDVVPVSLLMDPGNVLALCDLAERAERAEAERGQIFVEALRRAEEAAEAANELDEARATIERMRALADKWDIEDLDRRIEGDDPPRGLWSAAAVHLRRVLDGDQEATT